MPGQLNSLPNKTLQMYFSLPQVYWKHMGKCETATQKRTKKNKKAEKSEIAFVHISNKILFTCKQHSFWSLQHYYRRQMTHVWHNGRAVATRRLRRRVNVKNSSTSNFSIDNFYFYFYFFFDGRLGLHIMRTGKCVHLFLRYNYCILLYNYITT